MSLLFSSSFSTDGRAATGIIGKKAPNFVFLNRARNFLTY